MIDIFKNDAFSMVSLTDAINKMPHKPTRIGEMGLFVERGITTTTVVVEEKDGRLSLIETTPRGGAGSAIGTTKRTARSFVVPHLERDGKVYADEVQNVRAFGSDNAEEAVQTLIAQTQADLRAMHDVTLEYHRVGAITGVILDADGSTPIYNLFTEFGVSQQQYIMPFSSSSADMREECVAIQRLSEAELGAETVTGYHAFCGDDFFDALISHASVKESLKYQESQFLRNDLRRGFTYGGITWENYRGKVGSVQFIEDDEAYVVPLGTSIFRTYFAPADFIETANTVGLPLYSKLLPDPSGANRYVVVHTQSNPLCLCLRPRAVIRATIAT